MTTFIDDLNRVWPDQSIPTIPQSESNTSKLYYGTVKKTTTFTNADLGTVYLSIYEIVPRFYIVGATRTPSSLWQQGLNDQLLPGPFEPDTYLNVYNKPFESQFFTHFYKVLKVQKVELSSGASHKHVSTYHKNSSLIGYMRAVFHHSAKHTNFQMYIASGTPINDAEVPMNVSTSSVNINVVEDVNYNYTFSPSLRTRSVHTTDLGAIASANVVTDTQIVADNSP